MLAHPDIDLVRRDTRLPGLAILLDPDMFAAALRPHVSGIELGAPSIMYVRYKPGVSCLVTLQLDAAGEALKLYAVGRPPDARDKLRNSRQRAAVPGPLGRGRIDLVDRAVTVWVFPNDQKLEAITRLADAQSRERLLRKLLPGRPDLWGGTVRQLRYKPERRFVASLDIGADERAVVKLYTARGFETAGAKRERLKATGLLRVPKCIGRSNRHRILVFEWLPGRLLNEAMLDDEVSHHAAASAGAAIAEIHRQSAAALPPLTRQAEGAAVQAAAALVSFLSPEVAGRARSLASTLADRLLQLPLVDRPIHGDLDATQVLLTTDGVGILDLDEAVRGDPAADLGMFAARLERDSLRGTVPADRVEPLTQALRDGYRASFDIDLSRVDLYTAVGLVRLAPFPFREREPDWPARTTALLARAEAILDDLRRRPTGTAYDRGPLRPQGLKSTDASVIDPFGVSTDPQMPVLARALDPDEVQRQFEIGLVPARGSIGQIHVVAIRVTRYKPGRRCLIEYDLEVGGPGARQGLVTLVGKVRAKGPDVSGYRLIQALWHGGFSADSSDGICVPEPIGMIPAFHLWLQRKAPGVTATRLLAEPDGIALARRIAEAAHKLHRSGISPHRRHTMADELAILHDRMRRVAEMEPPWAGRLQWLLAACDRLGAAAPLLPRTGIHRDFYSDHVIVDGSRLYLVDFDLYCEGDPALDVGNFLGHLTEYSLRFLGKPDALAERQRAMEERFVTLAGEAARAGVHVYTTLTLVRHIYLCTQHSGRAHLAGALLDLCEQRLHGAPSREPA